MQAKQISTYLGRRKCAGSGGSWPSVSSDAHSTFLPANLAFIRVNRRKTIENSGQREN